MQKKDKIWYSINIFITSVTVGNQIAPVVPTSVLLASKLNLPQVKACHV